MASIISQVTDLDKKMRIKVQELEGKREKLPEFLREQKKKLVSKSELQSKVEVKAKKAEIDKVLDEARKSAKGELEVLLSKIEESYKENKDKWITEIYNQCIEDYMGD
jgi:uncharacterized protein YjbJ (UPF0337 family)